MPCNEVMSSNNVLIKDNDQFYFLSLGMKGKFIPKIPGENVSYPGKKIPRPEQTRNKIPRPDPTRPENILSNVTRSRTGFGPVRSSPGKLGVSGLPRRSLMQSPGIGLILVLEGVAFQ